jgi:hypothetical protein
MPAGRPVTTLSLALYILLCSCSGCSTQIASGRECENNVARFASVSLADCIAAVDAESACGLHFERHRSSGRCSCLARAYNYVLGSSRRKCRSPLDYQIMWSVSVPERKGDSTSELLHRAVSTGGVVRRRMVRTVHGRGLLSDHRRGRVYSLRRWDLCG